MAAKYAQHFLTNQHAAERIANALTITKEDSLLEIGPGKGTLSAFFISAKQFVIVEVDPEMIIRLQQRFASFSHIQIVHQDILKFDLSSLRSSDSELLFKVVGNLPYNLTSPILRQLSEWKGWSFAILMVQKEVGDRLCAAPGTSDYGALTVGMSLTTTVEPVFDLSQTSFSPPPKVMSSVIKVVRRFQPLTDDIKTTQRVIQAAFQQRRKTILNSLSHGLKLSKTEAELALNRCGVDPGVRPERLPVDKFIALARTLPIPSA